MASSHYWVVGGEFGSLNFHRLVPGTQQVSGPFATRSEAEEVWRSMSEAERHRCNVRFTIVRESARAESAAAA